MIIRLEDFQKQIKAFRRKKGLTQLKLAEMVDISPNHMRGIENGTSTPSVWTLLEVARCLDCSWNVILLMDSDTRDEWCSYLERLERLKPENQKKVMKVLDVLIDGFEGEAKK